MKSFLKPFALLVLSIAILSSSCKKDSNQPNTIIDFENLVLKADTFWNGSDLSNGFTCKNAFFANVYDVTYQYWSGFAYSDKHDEITTGFDNQFSAYALNDAYTNKFVVGYIPEFNVDSIKIVFTKQMSDCSLKVTNNTYAALSMKYGDTYAKKFGGANGTDPDWFKLTITCYDNSGIIKGVAEVKLADYSTTAKYIANDWKEVDLSAFGTLKTLSFKLSSTDNGESGMNTPSYFCLDDLAGNIVE